MKRTFASALLVAFITSFMMISVSHAQKFKPEVPGIDPENIKYIVVFLKKPGERGGVIVLNPDFSVADPEPAATPEGKNRVIIEKIDNEVILEYHRNPYTVCNRNICWRTK